MVQKKKPSVVDRQRGEINSPIGKTTFQPQPTQNWSVEDASDDGDDQFAIPADAVQQEGSEITPQEAMERRRQFAEQAEKGQVATKLTAKRRIELLLGIGRGTKEVPIDTEEGTVTFSIRTLKGKENKEVAALLENAKRVRNEAGEYILSPTGLYALRVLALKYAIYAIDGIEFDVVLGTVSAEQDQKISVRELFLEELDDTLVARLFGEYESLVMDNTAKYGIKSEAEAKEVAAEVSKSSKGS
jgi:hypothetical protein